jgi:hypothetical protein
MLNIIHCHLNDTGDEETVEVLHMKPLKLQEKREGT